MSPTHTPERHSPAPWTYTATPATSGPIGYVLQCGGPEPESFGELWNTRHEKAIANARLIAKAPELLEIVRAFAAHPVSPDSLCHLGICSAEECSRCGPILKALALLAEIEGTKP